MRTPLATPDKTVWCGAQPHCSETAGGALELIYRCLEVGEFVLEEIAHTEADACFPNRDFPAQGSVCADVGFSRFVVIDVIDAVRDGARAHVKRFVVFELDGIGKRPQLYRRK